MIFALVVFLPLLINNAVCEVDPKEQDFALEYLKKFEYLSPTNASSQNNTFAMKSFQTFFNLSVTGELNDETLEAMKKPRCGDPDVGIDGLRVRVRRFSLLGKWPKTNFKYYLSYGKDLPKTSQARIIKRAFKYWSDVCPTLNFTRTNDSSDTDIRISFGSYNHAGIPNEGSCPSPFDGPGQVIAHAVLPVNRRSAWGKIHFDESDTFTELGSSGYGWWSFRIGGSHSLIYVAVHEIGHSLGLGHSNIRNSVMYPLVKLGRPVLHNDDINGIRTLYCPGVTPIDDR